MARILAWILAGTLILACGAGTEMMAGTRGQGKSVPVKREVKRVPAKEKSVPVKEKSAEELARERKLAFAGATCWPVGETHSAAARVCTGNVYFVGMSMELGGPVCMTFEPAARTHWIIHHGRERVLVCVAGTGWFQAWGDRAVKLEEGDVVVVEDGVKHWCGARAGEWLQLLAYDQRIWRGWRDEGCEEVEDDWVERLERRK